MSKYKSSGRMPTETHSQHTARQVQTSTNEKAGKAKEKHEQSEEEAC
jgi:hypothetical protein